jgi:hypothetical protein
MQDDRAWDRIADAIDTKYGLVDHGRSKRPVADAQHLTEYISYIVFDREGERYKVERVQGPAIIDRKTMGARRAGAVTRMENVYNADEVSFRTNLYRQEGDDWTAIDPSALGL